MLRLKDKSKGVPDGFRYVHEDGFISTGINWWEMWSGGPTAVTKHRSANGLPPVSEATVEEQICKQAGPAYCEQEQPGDFRFVNTRLRFGDIVNGTKAYLALMASGFETVDRTEANRRAKICASCFLNVQPQGCGACVKLASLITGDIAMKKTAYDDHLTNKACAVCHCGTKSIVHFPMPLLENADSDSNQSVYPEFCWRNQSGENYQS